jgi:hypothetical protein
MKFATLSIIRDLLMNEACETEKAVDEAHSALRSATQRVDLIEDRGEQPPEELMTIYRSAMEEYRTKKRRHDRAVDALADFDETDFH